MVVDGIDWHTVALHDERVVGGHSIYFYYSLTGTPFYDAMSVIEEMAAEVLVREQPPAETDRVD